ncbi:hypothetical protein [Rickettsiella endosymbiont of Dermanyssus gallinae]|uniref:hypothetical protein n=1 Tax=Rickettsiella endosymbiont of Dermanyssus gallinae TaxID=2856608 RepID=UPI001C5283E0|nr:hypothetical protein [Rickettsiella endosymbiont of Dermanyssus gallinae]
MRPNTGITISDTVSPLLQHNQLLRDWLNDCLSPSKTQLQVWTSDWIESLRAGLKKADSAFIKQGYEELIDQLNNLLQQQYATDENVQSNWVSALLLLLLVMHVYRETTAECCHDQLIECPSMRWTEHANRVMAIAPKVLYLKQLSRLVREAISKKPIDSIVDRALFQIHQHALKFCFKQFLNGLRHTDQDCPPPDEEHSTYKSYVHMICMLHVYITQLSDLPRKEKEYLPNLLLKQLTKLIKDTSELDLSPSWMDRLKQWIQQFFGKLKLLYTTIPSTTETSSSALLAISQQLRKSAQQAAQKKELHSPELIRERCWLYFSLYEQIIAQYWDSEKYALNYQSTTLALFESFMSTFNWPFTFRKGILRENPLKPSRFKFSRKKTIPLEHCEPLLDKTLTKLSEDFFKTDWFYLDSIPHPERRSFLHWLVSRHEPRLIAKIKDYISKEGIEFQQDEILELDKRNLYRLVQAVHEDFCKELNLITQMILSVWFRDAGIRVSHADLARMLLKPGCWLYLNPEVPLTLESSITRFAFFMLQAIERLGAGIYFFPPLQQRWSTFQAALTAHSGKVTEFIRQHDADIAAILKKLFLMFHPDHQSEAERNDPISKNWAQRYLYRIQHTKSNLQKFRELAANEQQNIDDETERKAESLLKWLKDVVLDCMDCHVAQQRMAVRLFSLSDDDLRRCYDHKTYETITKRKQIEADTISERKKLKEELKEKDAEIERLKALLAEQEGQTLSQPSIAGSRLTLFPTPTTSQAPTDVANLVIAKCP